MNLKGFKKNTALKFIKKHIDDVKENQQSSLKKIKTVGILADSDLYKAYDFTKFLCEKIDIRNSDIKIFLYQESDLDKNHENYKFFNDKSFNLRGKIKDLKVKHFANKEFDLLINYCKQDNIFAHLIAFQSKAKMKVSFETDELKIYDVYINIEENKIDAFNNELVKYLHILKLIN